jgi:hypothetical protein
VFAAYPLRFNRRCQSRSPRAPSCVMWFSGESTPLPTHSQPDGSHESPHNPHNRLVRQTRFCHILHQAVPIYAHGCTIFMGGRSMNRSIDLGMMSTPGFLESTGHSPELSESTERSSKPVTPNPILHTNRIQEI